VTDDDLRTWALAHPNMPQAVAVLRLLAEADRMVGLTEADADRLIDLLTAGIAVTDRAG
jgi:hypothetical protein